MTKLEDMERRLAAAGIKPKAAQELFTPEERRKIAEIKIQTKHHYGPTAFVGKTIDATQNLAAWQRGGP